MPKIFEYFGILLFFYSSEHEPIHVHGKKASLKVKQNSISLMAKFQR